MHYFSHILKQGNLASVIFSLPLTCPMSLSGFIRLGEPGVQVDVRITSHPEMDLNAQCHTLEVNELTTAPY